MRPKSLLSAIVLASAALAPVALATPVAASAPGLAWSQSVPSSDRTSSPTIADVNGDGVPEIVVGNQDGWLRVLDAASGNNIAGWPQPVIVAGGGSTAVDGTAAVADLDGNGSAEIIVPAGSTWRPNQQGGVVVFNSNGTVRCRFQTIDQMNTWGGGVGADGYSDGVFSSPAIGDVDGDGRPDITFGAWDLRVHSIDMNCRELSGFPYNVDDTEWSSPALYDVDGDGRMEIFIGGDQTPGGISDWSGGEFRALDWANGSVRELWRTRTDDVITSSPAIGDINGDGRLEAVVGAGDFYHRGDSTKVFAWHIDNGSAVPGWPVNTGGVTYSSPALGDLDGNGTLDVVIGSRDGYVRAYNGSGGLLWAHRARFNTQPGQFVNASPIIADLNGDGRNDVGVGNEWGFFLLEGKTGNEMSAVNTWVSFEAAGAVGNFGPHGWKLITVGFVQPTNTTFMQAHNIPAPGVTPPWPMFRKTANHLAAPPSGGDPLPPGACARNSNPTPSPSAASSKGYWVLGIDGGVYSFGVPFFGSAYGAMKGGAAVGIAATGSGNGYYILTSLGEILPFGDARSFGSMAGTRLNAPIIALAPTPTGKGYWLLASDGGVFSFGDAAFYGSTGAMKLNSPIISMAPTRGGRGYWLLASDGGVFSFGDAKFYGSTGAMKLNAPVISMATSPHGDGYWLVARDGGVFSFGVPFYGSLPGLGLCNPPRGMQIRPTLTGKGYYLLASDGGIFTMGDAQFMGAQPGLHMFNFALEMALRP